MQSEWTQSGDAVLSSLSGINVARLVSSLDGPKLIINHEEYILKEACWDVEMFHGKINSILIFYWKGEVKLSVKIAPISNPLLLHHSLVSMSQPTATSQPPIWSKVEAFLARLYQCLTVSSRTVKPA